MLSYVFMCVSSLQSGSPLRIQTIQPPSLLPASAAVLFSGAAGGCANDPSWAWPKNCPVYPWAMVPVAPIPIPVMPMPTMPMNLDWWMRCVTAAFMREPLTLIPMLQVFAYKIQWVWRSFEILFHAVSKQAPLKSAVKLTLFGIGHLSAKAVGRCLGRDGKSFGKLKFEHVAKNFDGVVCGTPSNAQFRPTRSWPPWCILQAQAVTFGLARESDA